MLLAAIFRAPFGGTKRSMRRDAKMPREILCEKKMSQSNDSNQIYII